MPRRCSIPGCRSNYDKEPVRYSTFSLPKEETLRSKWISSIPANVSGIKHPNICIKHFREADVIWMDRVMYKNEMREFLRVIPKLAPGAIPTIFNNQHYPDDSIKNVSNIQICWDRNINSAIPVAENNDNQIEIDPLSFEKEYFLEEPLAKPCESEQSFFKSEPSGVSYVDTEVDIHKFTFVDCENNFSNTFDLKQNHVASADDDHKYECNKSEIVMLEEGNNAEDDRNDAKGLNTPFQEPMRSLFLHELPNLMSPNYKNVEEIIPFSHCHDLNNTILTNLNNVNACVKPQTEENHYSCDMCKTTFKECRLDSHMKIHTAEETYVCDVCKKTFKFILHLKRHMKLHIFEKSYFCVECKKIFLQSSNLKKHMLIHTSEKPYCCEECGKLFRASSTLITHMRLHTGEKPFCCNECEKCFVHSYSLTAHMKTHTGEKPYSCEVCEKQFTERTSLRIHMRIHTGEKPYFCKTCMKRFKRNFDLINHLRTHTGDKPYCCEICKRRFAERGALMIHIRLHSGEKPYCCRKCMKRFTQKSHFNEHIRIHTNDKRYCCDVCKKRFIQSFGLKRHMKLHM